MITVWLKPHEGFFLPKPCLLIPVLPSEMGKAALGKGEQLRPGLLSSLPLPSHATLKQRRTDLASWFLVTDGGVLLVLTIAQGCVDLQQVSSELTCVKEFCTL